jgi:hypothetical protein
MQSKYQKPLARNLGESLSIAQGICLSGSVANDVALANCIATGALASGGNCTVGTAVSGCQTGRVPDIDTCYNGTGVGGAG